jgi:glycosyltransferase involved in cell wall biosynthesis
MKIAVICAYPPSRGTLTEYNFHFINHFINKKEVSELIIITDKLPNNCLYPKDTNDKVKIIDCWTFNSYTSVWNIIRAVNNHKPDIVLFNIQFLSFGDKKIPAALGLMLPAWFKITKNNVVVLLHNIVEQVDLSTAGITKNKILSFLFNSIGTFLTKRLLKADLLTLTISKYVEILEKKYNKTNIALIPHGAFEVPPIPDFNEGATPWSVMAFGKFGTYKKVEILIDAVLLLRIRLKMPIEIVIAGTDNPNAIGYLNRIKKNYNGLNDIHFTGYVEEVDVPTIFKKSTVVVFPYTSTTGSSGILHQAGSYGKAVVLPNIGDLSKLVEEEGYRGEFFDPENVNSLANAIERVLLSNRYRRILGEKNYIASASLPMADITDWYIFHFNEIIKKNKNL